MSPAVVDLEHDSVDERDILVHDCHTASPALAALLASLEPPEFPTAMGIFREVDKPTYNDMLFGQIQHCVTQRGKGNLKRLLNAGTTWEVT